MLSTLGEVVVAANSHTPAPSEQVLTKSDLTILSYLAADPFDVGLALERLMADAHQD